jgi:hypothetical protein
VQYFYIYKWFIRKIPAHAYLKFWVSNHQSSSFFRKISCALFTWNPFIRQLYFKKKTKACIIVVPITALKATYQAKLFLGGESSLYPIRVAAGSCVIKTNEHIYIYEDGWVGQNTTVVGSYLLVW